MIRAATIDDADRVASLYISCRKRHVSCAPLAHSEEEIRHWIRHLLIPRQRVLVVEELGAIRAMMALSISADGGWIDQLYVDPDLTGRGYGAALVARAKQELPSPIRLHTFQANHGARRFYEREGFVAVSFSNGETNEERCPDVLYAWTRTGAPKGREA